MCSAKMSGILFLIILPLMLNWAPTIQGSYNFRTDLPPDQDLFPDYAKPATLAYTVRYNMDPTPNEVKFVDLGIQLLYVETLKASVNKAYCYLVYRTIAGMLSSAYDVSQYHIDSIENNEALATSLRNIENYLGSIFARHKIQGDALNLINGLIRKPIKDELTRSSDLIPKFFERLSVLIVSDPSFIISVVSNTLTSLNSSPGLLFIREFDHYMSLSNVAPKQPIDNVITALKDPQQNLLPILNQILRSPQGEILSSGAADGKIGYKWSDELIFLFDDELAKSVAKYASTVHHISNYPSAKSVPIDFCSGLLAPQSVLVTTTFETFLKQQFRLTTPLSNAVVAGQNKAIKGSDVIVGINPLQYQTLLRTLYQQLASMLFDALVEKFSTAVEFTKWTQLPSVADSINYDIFSMLQSAIGNFMTDIQSSKFLRDKVVEVTKQKITILIAVRGDIAGGDQDYFTIQEWEELRRSIAIQIASNENIVNSVKSSIAGDLKNQWGANLCISLQVCLDKVGAAKQNLMEFGKSALGIPADLFKNLLKLFGKVLGRAFYTDVGENLGIDNKKWIQVFG